MRVPETMATLSLVERVVATHGRAALCHIVRVEGSTPGKPGWRLLVQPDGEAHGNLGGGAFEAMVARDATEKLAQRAPQAEIKRYYLTEKAVQGEATGMVCGGMAEVFIEVLRQTPLLVVCGGGPVGQAVSRAAELAGFEILVAEDRDEFRAPGLFPADATTVKVDRRYSEDFLSPAGGRDLYVVIVTRCWETDTAALASVLRQEPENLQYLGLMGSERKVAHVAEAIEAQGLSLEGRDLHAPIGKRLGDSPGAIAISILAEVLESRQRAERTPALGLKRRASA